MKLKNLFGMAAMAALVLSGCSNDEVVNDYSPENAIEFGTYVGRDAQGRGSIYNTSTLKGTVGNKGGFGVFAYYTAQTTWDKYEPTTIPNFMNNTKVTWTGDEVKDADGKVTGTSLDAGVWTYSPLKYWPNNSGDKVSFFAYAPYAEERTLVKVNESVPANAIKVTVPVDVTNHQDYVVADAKLDQTKQTVTGTVKFEFKHVLSRVGFKVEAVVDEVQHEGTTDGSSQNGEDDTEEGTNTLDENTEITIQEVKLIGDFYKSNTIDFTTSTWNTETTGITKYETADQWEGGYLLTSDDFNAIATDGSISTIKSTSLLNKDSEYMMIIPKEFKDNDLVKIRVKYTVTTTDSALPEGKSEVINNITSDAFAFNFMKGKAYNFVLHLGLTSVKLSAEVSGWDEAEDIIVNVPINSDDDTTGGTSNTPSQGEGGGQENTGGLGNS